LLWQELVAQESLLTLPVLVLKDFSLFPHCIMRFQPEQMSQTQRQMLESASASGTQIFIVKSRSGIVDAPTQADLHRIGTIAKAGPKHTVGKWAAIQVSGVSRGELVDLQPSQEWPTAQVRQFRHIPAKGEAALDALKAAMAPWDEYEILGYDAGIHSGGIQMSPPDVDIEDPAVLCDVLANGGQFRIENEKDVIFLDLQSLLDERDPFVRFKLFGEIFQAELEHLKNDPELSRKIEIEQGRRRQEEEQRRKERSEKIGALAAFSAQPRQIKPATPMENEILDLPMLPLRDQVIWPFQKSSFIVGRNRSINAVEMASTDKLIVLIAQRDEQMEEPEQSDLFEIGTVARIIESFHLPDGNIRLMAQGLRKAKILKLTTARNRNNISLQGVKRPGQPAAIACSKKKGLATCQP
jgi:ATP-dependent Lon protease